MKPELIGDIMDTIRVFGITFDYFYIVTNAHTTYKRKAFLDVLDRLHAWAEDPESCSLVVSQDEYHQEQHSPNFRLYDTGKYEWDEPREYIRLDQRKGKIGDGLRNEGRARNIGGKKQPTDEPQPWVVDRYEDSSIVVGGEDGQNVYVSANGNVTSECNLSFDHIDAIKVGNVNETPLEQIILSFCEDEEMEKVA